MHLEPQEQVQAVWVWLGLIAPCKFGSSEKLELKWQNSKLLARCYSFMHSYLTLELCHLVKLSYVALLDSGCVLSTELFTLLRIIM